MVYLIFEVDEEQMVSFHPNSDQTSNLVSRSMTHLAR